MRRLFAVALLCAFLGGALVVLAREPSARELYKNGRKYEKKKDFAHAYLLYAQAAAADPSHPEYWQRAQALQRKAITASNAMPASSSLVTTSPEPEPDAATPAPVPTPEEIVEARRPQPPVEIQASPERRSFELRADSKSLWEQVAKGYALDVVFDGDYQAGPVQVFRLTDAGYREALHALMTGTGSFIVPVSTRLLLVVKDTEAKRREVENTIAVSIPIPDPVTVQEAQELARTVQQVMEIQKFAVDAAHRMAIMRDRISKVRPAQLLFEQLLSRRAQVALEVDLISVGSSSTIGLGLGLPTSFPITSLVKTIPLQGASLGFALGITGANLLAKATRSDARTYYEAEVRSVDGQPATFQVGQKYPIMTLNYIGQTTPGQTVYTPPPMFNFEDLGLTLKITPRVHDSQELTLEIEADFKLLGSGSLNGIPVISNRKFLSRARLRFDEAAVISGLITNNDFRTLSGPAGLLNIPVLGAVLGESNVTRDDIRVLLVIKPQLLNLPPTEMVTHDIWVGTESRPRIPL